MTVTFIINSILLGIGLAMDAFSVSIADGLAFPGMKGRVKIRIASVFAFCQFLMPFLGWAFVSLLENTFRKVSPFIPWIAFAMLLFIGGKMIVEAVIDAVKSKKEDNKETDSKDADLKKLTVTALIIQGIATSLDALSAGFTIAEYDLIHAVLCGLIIAAVTFALCMVGVTIGKKAGEKLSVFASILGGVILIAIGVKILLGI